MLFGVQLEFAVTGPKYRQGHGTGQQIKAGGQGKNQGPTGSKPWSPVRCNVCTPLAPEIPTIAEAGLPGFDASLWYGVVAPAKTPAEVVAVLGTAIDEALKNPEIRERLLALGSTPAEPAGPAAFAKFLKDEEDKWPDVVRASGAPAQ